MIIKEYEDKANELLEEIKKERILTLDFLDRLSKKLNKKSFEILGTMQKNYLLGNKWYDKSRDRDGDRYKFFIEDLKDEIEFYYEMVEQNLYLKKQPQFDNEYFKRINYELFRKDVWLSLPKDNAGFVLNKQNIKNIQYSLTKKEGFKRIMVGKEVSINGKWFGYKVNTVLGVLPLVLNYVDSEEFQLDYYKNYCEHLKNIGNEYKKTRLHLYLIEKPELFNEILNQQEVSVKRGPALKRKRVGAKIN